MVSRLGFWEKFWAPAKAIEILKQFKLVDPSQEDVLTSEIIGNYDYARGSKLTTVSAKGKVAKYTIPKVNIRIFTGHPAKRDHIVFNRTYWNKIKILRNGKDEKTLTSSNNSYFCWISEDLSVTKELATPASPF